MSDMQKIKVGLISCSGEEIPEGTLSRTAVRLVLEKLRPDKTVTICLPLFLSGEQGERTFAKNFPTIVADGCSKGCARIGTEKYSGKVDDVVVVDQVLKEWGETITCRRSLLDEKGWKLAMRLAEEIAGRVDILLQKYETSLAAPEGMEPVCSCMTAVKTISLEIEGKKVDLIALEMVLRLVAGKKDLGPDEIKNELVKQVKLYNGPMEEINEEALRDLLFDIFEAYTKEVAPGGNL